MGSQKLCRIAIWSALAVAGQVALSSIPNCEVVTPLIMAVTIVYGLSDGIGVAFMFSVLECLVWGLGLWNLMYFFVWPMLCIITWITSRFTTGKVALGIVSGLYGLSFGALCCVPYFFFMGWEGTVIWWLQGLSFDAMHCFWNTVMGFVALPILLKAMRSCLSGEGVRD